MLLPQRGGARRTDEVLHPVEEFAKVSVLAKEGGALLREFEFVRDRQFAEIAKQRLGDRILSLRETVDKTFLGSGSDARMKAIAIASAVDVSNALGFVADPCGDPAPFVDPHQRAADARGAIDGVIQARQA
jgi:hypothetical protein